VTDQTTPAGATPAVAGATPAQTTPVSPAAGAAPADATTTPATGDAALGDGAKSAIEKERHARREADDRAKALQTELDALKAAGQSDTEKAITQAKKDGGAEVLARVQAQIRRSEVKAALIGNGINASVLDLAVNAPEFAALKVSDDGEVDGLEAAVAKFKTGRADLFTKPVQPGSSDGGTRGATRLTKAEVDRITKDPVQYDKRRDEVIDWLATQQQ
jgi:hypothetical protein